MADGGGEEPEDHLAQLCKGWATHSQPCAPYISGSTKDKNF